MIGLILLNVLAQLADYATTRLALRRGAVELNPAAWFVLCRLGPDIWGLAKLIAALVATYGAQAHGVDLTVFQYRIVLEAPNNTIPMLTAALSLGIAFWNWRLSRR